MSRRRSGLAYLHTTLLPGRVLEKIVTDGQKTAYMTFEPLKRSLLRFICVRPPRLEAVVMASVRVLPLEDAQFLGMILDRILDLHAHRAHITKPTLYAEVCSLQHRCGNIECSDAPRPGCVQGCY